MAETIVSPPHNSGHTPRRHREPATNIPGFILGFGLLLIAIHGVRTLVLSPQQDAWTLIVFAFDPARYGAFAAEYPIAPARYWTPFTYALLHASWTHLLVNLMWLASFGSALVRRIGALQCLLLSALCALCGVLVLFAWLGADGAPVIGASAIVSGYMGAATRFLFQPGKTGSISLRGPTLSLLQCITDSRVRSVIIVWLALNYLLGSGIFPIAGEGVEIAWQAHLGGFAAGLFGFSLVARR